MKQIQHFIMNYMQNSSKEKIENYILSFYDEGNITSSQCDYLMDWLDKYMEVR